MKTDSRSEIPYLIGFVVLLAACLAGLYFYDTQSSSKRKKGNGKPIGSIESTVSDVRRKSILDLAWEQAGQQDKVYEGDSIFTGENSETTLNLNQGGELNVAANSLVVLTQQSGQMSLDVQYGTLTGTLGANQTLKLKVNGQETEIKGAGEAAKLKIRADGQVAVLQGSAKVNGQDVNKNENLDLKSGQKSEHVDPLLSDIKLQEPSDGAVIIQAKEKPINFRWEAPETEKDLLVEVSKSTGFANPIWTSQKVINNKVSTTALNNAGPVYWRVRSAKTKAISPTYRLGAFVNGPVTLVLPANDEVLTIAKEVGLQQSVRFEWDDTAPATRYVFQVARDADFKDVVVQGNVRTTAIESQPLQSGNYYWRVKPEHSHRPEVDWSVGKFRVEAETLMKPMNPKMVQNPIEVNLVSEVADVKKFAGLSAKAKKAYLLDNIKNPVILAWEPVAGIKKYQVQVALMQDPQFTNPLLDKVVEGKQLTWTKTPPGNFLWRIKAIKDNGVMSETDVMGRIVARVAPPRYFSTEPMIERVPSAKDFNRPLRRVNLKWQEVVHAEQYEVQLAANYTFENPNSEISKGPAVNVVPPGVGKSYYRVRALNERTDPIGPFSPPQEIIYDRRVELNIPKVIRPVHNSSSIFIGAGQREILLTWEPVDGALIYDYQLANDKLFQQMIKAGESKNARVLINKNLKVGDYYWRVKARNSTSNMESPWHDPIFFSINTFIDRKPASK